jgi:hypothetical protein
MIRPPMVASIKSAIITINRFEDNALSGRDEHVDMNGFPANKRCERTYGDRG